MMRDVHKGPLAGGKVRSAGGVPIEKLECWLLGLGRESRAHDDHDPVASLETRHGVPPKRVTAMVQLVRRSRLLDAPADAQSLWRWPPRAGPPPPAQNPQPPPTQALETWVAGRAGAPQPRARP